MDGADLNWPPLSNAEMAEVWAEIRCRLGAAAILAGEIEARYREAGDEVLPLDDAGH